MADFKELLQAQKETTDALRKVALAQGQTFETAKESLIQQKNANRVAGGIKAAETRKANAEKASKGQLAKKARDDRTNANNERSIFKKMLGSLVDIKGSFGKLAGGAKKSIFAALKGLAIGGLILALAEFFDSDMFKKLTKKIGEISQSFADVYTAFSEEGFLAGLKSIKDNLGNLLLGIGGIGLLFAPGLMFKGLMFGGKLAYSMGAFVIGDTFKALFKTNFFGIGGIFSKLKGGITSVAKGMGNALRTAGKTGILAGSKVVGSIRAGFSSFFGKGGALRNLGSKIGGVASKMLTKLTSSTFATKIADKFAGFFGKGGALRTLASNIGTTASNLTSRLARAVKTGLFAGKTSILSKFGTLFSPLRNFGTKIADVTKNLVTRLANSSSLSTIKGAVGSIGSKFSNLFGSTRAFAGRLGSASVDMAKRLLSSVSLSNAKGAAGAIASKFGNLFGSTRAFASRLGTSAVDMAARLGKSVSLGTTGIVSKFTSLFTHTASFGTKVAGVAKSMLTSLGSSAALGIKGAAGTIVSGFGKLFTHSASFGSKVTEIGGKMLTRLTTSISTGALSPTGIMTGFKSMFGVLGTFGSKLGSLASSATSALGNVIKSTIASLPPSIKNVVSKGVGTATKIGTKLVSGIGSMVAPVGSKTSLAARTAAALAKRTPVVKAPNTKITTSNKKPNLDPTKSAKLLKTYPNLEKVTKVLGKFPGIGKIITGGLLLNILLKGGKPADMAGDIGGLFGAVGGAALGGALGGMIGLAGGPLSLLTGLAGAVGGGFAGDALGRALGQFIVGINPIDAFGWPFNWVDDLINGGVGMMGSGDVSSQIEAARSAEAASALGSTSSGMAGMMGSSGGGPQTHTGTQLQAKSINPAYGGSGAFDKQMGVNTTVINSSGGNTTNHTSMNQMLGNPDQVLSSASR